MSKLSHNKAVARHRRTKHGRCHHYTKKEMKQMYPQFRGEKLNAFKAITCHFTVNGKDFTIKLDKNYQICDCTPRIGNIFSQLYGRVLSSELNIVDRVQNELDNIDHI